MLEALDPQAVRRWYEWGVAALDASRDEINSLNVFPVPDADTGTNLHLTLESAVNPADVEERGPLAGADLAATATEMARLSLLGARGSSGVILSQLLRGVAETLAEQRRPPRGIGLTRALQRGSALAYAAVSQPVEGTMLTVARAAAEAAAATGSDDLRVVVTAAAGAAHEALAETPTQLDVLGRAGVVDAGGRGVVVLLDVLTAIVEERPLPSVAGPIAHPRLDAIESGARPAYEVMYLLDAPDHEIAGLRHDLDRVGDSVVVSGGGGLWNVHVHTDDADHADDAVRLGAAVGLPHQIRITPIAGASHLAIVVAADDSPALALRAVFEAAGARVVAISPSSVDQVCALQSADVALLTLPESEVAARGIAEMLVARGVRAVTLVAASAVQLLAAVAVHDPHEAPPRDVEAMAVSIANTRHIDVRPRGAEFIAVATGFEPILGSEPAEVAVRMLDLLIADGAELVTVVAAAKVAARIEEHARKMSGGIEVTTVVAELDGAVWVGVE